jgi:hypothetical protein
LAAVTSHSRATNTEQHTRHELQESTSLLLHCLRQTERNLIQKKTTRQRRRNRRSLNNTTLYNQIVQQHNQTTPATKHSLYCYYCTFPSPEEASSHRQRHKTYNKTNKNKATMTTLANTRSSSNSSAFLQCLPAPRLPPLSATYATMVPYKSSCATILHRRRRRRRRREEEELCGGRGGESPLAEQSRAEQRRGRVLWAQIECTCVQ